MKKLLAVFITLLVMGSYGIVNAFTWAEVGDAGSLPSTAQIVTGIGTLDYITGNISSSDIDMFDIYLSGGSFSAATYPLSSISDPELYLFDNSGNLITFNDDYNGLQSYISGNFVAGNYFLAIAAYYHYPYDNPITSWNGSGGSTGSYDITLTGATAASSAVPEPATMLLLGSGLIGLAGLGRKKFIKS